MCLVTDHIDLRANIKFVVCTDSSVHTTYAQLFVLIAGPSEKPHTLHLLS